MYTYYGRDGVERDDEAQEAHGTPSLGAATEAAFQVDAFTYPAGSSSGGASGADAAAYTRMPYAVYSAGGGRDEDEGATAVPQMDVADFYHAPTVADLSIEHQADLVVHGAEEQDVAFFSEETRADLVREFED